VHWETCKSLVSQESSKLLLVLSNIVVLAFGPVGTHANFLFLSRPPPPESESESEILYDWRFIAKEFVLATRPLRPTTSNFIFQANACGYSPYIISLTRGWICRIHLLLALASAAILRSQSRGTYDHVLLSQIRDSPNLEGQVPVFISPRNRVARLYT
jgi:hypothetical protein